MDGSCDIRPSINGRRGAALRRVLGASLLALCWLGAPAARAADQGPNTLKAIHFSALGGNRVRIELDLAKPAEKPSSFTVDNPARIALDFPDTVSDVDKKTQTIDIGAAHRITAVESRGRTRVVVDLIKPVPFDVDVKGDKVFVTLSSQAAVADTAAPFRLTSTAKASAMAGGGGAVDQFQGIDFRRGAQGEGRIVVKLSNPDAAIDMRQQEGKIVVDMLNTSIKDDLVKRYDVVDFGTPVQTIDVFRSGSGVRLVIDANRPYEHLAYQTKDAFTIEVKPITKSEQEAKAQQRVGYTGKKLSLNFQNIDIRAALQLIADFTGLNLVTSDSVSGNLTLRLQSVPWDQALDIILKTKGLAMRKMGNVILVAPATEISAHEKQELESRKQIADLVPLHSELIQINYAKATDIAALLKDKSNSLLSKRGSVAIDDRTNTLLVQDTDDKLSEIRKLIDRLDVPVRQVLIESRIVIASNDFSRDLGVRFGATDANATGPAGDKGLFATSASANGANSIVTSGSTSPIPAAGQYNVDLPAPAGAPSIGLALLSSHYLLDLELSALQAEGRGEVISSPRVITANQRQALIEQGVEIPYQQATSSGATSVSFKNATLSLKVTPQITPDDHIIMDLNVTKDSVGTVFQGVPSINTREITTQVLVDNGQTVVLGGVFEQTHTNNESKVPFLGDVPVLGHLFKQSTAVNNKEELLVFITPKILKQSLSVNP